MSVPGTHAQQALLQTVASSLIGNRALHLVIGDCGVIRINAGNIGATKQEVCTVIDTPIKAFDNFGCSTKHTKN